MVSTVYDLYLDLYDKDIIHKERWNIYYGSESSPKAWNKELVLDPGTYYLKVTPYGNNYGTYDLKWIKNIIVSSIKISGKKTMESGKSALFKATCMPNNATDKSVTWNSSDTNVAYVDSTGRVTARNCGKATITATANDGSGKVGTYKVVVTPTKLGQPYSYGNRSYIYLSWGSQGGASGYQIQYSKSSSMKDAKIVKIKGDKTHYRYFRYLERNKRFYFRVRAYAKIGKTTYYGTWSKKTYAKTR